MKTDQAQIGAYDQGSLCSICGQNMRLKDPSLGTVHLVAGLFATTVYSLFTDATSATSIILDQPNVYSIDSCK